MPEPRPRRAARPAAPRPAAPSAGRPAPGGRGANRLGAVRRSLRRLRPDLSWRGLRQLGTRVVLACGAVAILAVLASWSASGFLDRGGIERLISMGNTPSPEPATPAARRGGLDRGRLRAVIAAGAH